MYYSESDKYKNFEFIDVAVLPDDCDEAEVKALEKRLQIQKTHRAEYKWHNKAAMMKEERESGVAPEVLAKSYDVQKKEVDVLIGALEYADIYLRSIEKKDQWSIVDDDEFAFKAMVEERKKIPDQGRKELFEAVCFKLIETKDYQGRLYSGIPDIAANLDAIAEALRDKGLIPKDKNTPTGQPDDNKTDGAEADSNGTDEDDIDLLGGDDTQKDTYSELASAVQTSEVKLGGIVKQIADEQKAIKNEQKSSKYLLNTLSTVAKYLWNIRSNGLNENTILEGTQAQLDTIKEHISEIEQWIKDHQK